MEQQLNLKNLLIVEDDSSLLNLLFETLSSVGFTVEKSADGVMALQKCKEKFYDLILLDIMLPGLDGISLLRKMNEENIKYGKVIVYSNLANEEFSNLMKEQLRVEEYLYKADVSLQDVRKVIQNHIT